MAGSGLQGANLRSANLTGVWLQETSLKGANLEGANFKGAMASETDLRGANLKDAIVEISVLGDCYLGNTIMPDGQVITNHECKVPNSQLNNISNL